MTGPHFLRIRPGDQPTGVPVRQPYRHDSRPAERTAAGRSARKREKKAGTRPATRSIRNRRDRRTSGAGVRPPRSAGTKKPAAMDIRGRFFGSQQGPAGKRLSSRKRRKPAFPTESPSLQQRQQLPERSDPVRRTAFARHTRGIEPDRIDPGPLRAGNIAVRVVADHHGRTGLYPCQIEGVFENARIGFVRPASSEQTTPRK